jgi:hypothetical protein
MLHIGGMNSAGSAKSGRRSCDLRFDALKGFSEFLGPVLPLSGAPHQLFDQALRQDFGRSIHQPNSSPGSFPKLFWECIKLSVVVYIEMFWTGHGGRKTGMQ